MTDEPDATTAPHARKSHSPAREGGIGEGAREASASGPRAIERAVARAIAQHQLWEPGAPLVVAVSGGADSLCLLGALVALRAQGNPIAPGMLTVAHLDHGLRPEGADDAQFVNSLASNLGLRYVSEQVDIRASARDARRGIEDAARRARYAFLRRVMAEVGATAIATGHTADDQVETIVLHWLRGSGLAGLRGMRWRSRGVVRPLLELTHAQTLAYCADLGWEPREDASNADLRFARNRVRHELLPLLRTYNAGIDTLLTRNAALLAADDDALEVLAAEAWPSVALSIVQEGVPARMDLALVALRELPDAVRYRLYRRAAVLLGGEDARLEARHLFQLDDLALGSASGRATALPGGLRAERGYEALTFQRAVNLHAGGSDQSLTRVGPALQDVGDASAAIRLPVPGIVELPTLGWRLRAWLSDGPPGTLPALVSPAPGLPPFVRAGSAADLGIAEMRVTLDADVAGEELTVRPWRPGDRFQPFGMPREKKVQDYFTDAKVPRALRRRLPLVFSRSHLLWVAGQRLDHRAQVTPTTRRVLTLQLEPL